MFRYVTESAASIGKRRAYVPLSIAVHLIVVTAAILIPIFAPGALPVPATTLMAFISRDAPPPPPPPAPPAAIDRTRAMEAPSAELNPYAAPLVSPATIAPESVGETTRGMIRGVEGGVGNVLGDALGVRGELPPPPPPPAEPEKPFRVGTGITRPQKIHDVTPVYPILAQRSRVEGIVILEATIGASGDVVDAKVLRGHPLLDAAALGAVQQWRFTPTLLNGKAVTVVMTVTVEFKLQ